MSLDLNLSRLAARMLMPGRAVPGAMTLPPNAYQETVDGLVANKVPLLSLNHARDIDPTFFVSEPFSTAHAAEQARWSGFRETYVAVHQVLAQSGIKDVLIKSIGLAPSLPYKSDNMDTMVRQDQGPAARQTLLSLGYIELRNVEEPHKFLFRKFHAGRSVSAIHLHEFVGWGTGFMRDEGVLERARPSQDDPEVWVPAAEDALLITMAHAFYEDKAIKLGDLWKVMLLLRGEPLDWDSIYEQAHARGWLEGLHTCMLLWAAAEEALYGEHSFPERELSRARKEAPAYCLKAVKARTETIDRFPIGVSFRFSKRHYYGKVWRDPALSLGQRIEDTWKHSWAGVARRLPFQAQRPALIALCGVDGSGKTEQARLLAQVLDTCALHHRTVWSRGASSPLADAVIRLCKPLVARGSTMDTMSDSADAKLERKSAWLRRPVLRAGWKALVAVDLIWLYATHIVPQLVMGRIVIADRYVYDALVELSVLTDSGALAEGCYARILRLKCPRPSLAAYLRVTPEIAAARKPDEPAEYIERQVLMFDRMSAAWAMETYDADDDLFGLSNALVLRALGDYYRGWDRIKGLSPMRRGR